MSQSDVMSRVRAGLEHVKDELEQAEAALKLAPQALAQRLTPALAGLTSAREAAVAALRRLEEEAAGTREAVVANLDREYRRLEAQLRILRSELRSELADNIEDYRSAAAEHLEAWRAGLDELRVRAHLGRTEARDELDALLDRLESRYHEAARQLRERTQEKTLATVRENLRAVFQDLRRAADTASETLQVNQGTDHDQSG